MAKAIHQCTEIWQLSDYFQCSYLREHCEYWLCERLTASNIGVVWKFAQEHKLKHLLNNTMQFFITNFLACSRVDEFYDLPKDFVKEALDKGEIDVKKDALFEIILDWCQHYESRNNTNSSTNVGRNQKFQSPLLQELLPPSTLFCTEIKSWLLSKGRLM